MTDIINPKRGDRFVHARQITRDSSAKDPVYDICTVTRVAKGLVYYHNSTGFKLYSSLESFPKEVREWLGQV
jgi:hypothetical protein